MAARASLINSFARSASSIGPGLWELDCDCALSENNSNTRTSNIGIRRANCPAKISIQVFTREAQWKLVFVPEPQWRSVFAPEAERILAGGGAQRNHPNQ